MTSKFPAHPNPNNVEIRIASAMQAQARPDVSPDEDEIDDGRRERKNRMRNWRRCVRPAVESPGNADVALQVAFVLANLANGHAQRQVLVLARGQLLCSLLSALVDVAAEARCAGVGAVIEVA